MPVNLTVIWKFSKKCWAGNAKTEFRDSSLRHSCIVLSCPCMLFFAYAGKLGRFFLPAPPKLQIMSLYLTTKIAQAVYLQENIFIFSLNFYPLIALLCPAFSNHLCRCSLQSFQHGGQFSVKKSILEIVSCVHSITDLLFCWPKEEELQLIFE